MVTSSVLLRRLRAQRGGLALGVVWLGAAGLSTALLLHPSVKQQGADATEGALAAVVPEPVMLPGASRFSGVTHLPGTSSVLLVDDDQADHIYRWALPRAGERAAAPVPISLPPGVRLEDGEGITTDGYHVYLLSSHSLTPQGKLRANSLARLRWEEDRLVLDGVITDLRERLEHAFDAVGRVRRRTPDDGGLNLEGLAWDPRSRRLLLGVRGPLMEGSPAVIPLRIGHDPASFDFTLEPPLPLPALTGHGIRSLEHDPVTGDLLILTGGVGHRAPGAAADNRFKLWRWSGEPDQPARRVTEFSRGIGGMAPRPEGVARVTRPDGGSSVLVVSDDAPIYWAIAFEPGGIPGGGGS